MRLLLCSALTMMMLLSSATQGVTEKYSTVRILFTNNSNGKLVNCNCPTDPFGGLAERVGLVREYHEYYGDSLLLDSGGYLGLSDIENRGRLVLELMEIMEYDACGIGDQELYHGLGKFLGRFGGWRDKILNASLVSDDGKPVFEPYRIFTVEGIKIGVLGLVSKDTFRFFPEENKDFSVVEPDVILERLLPDLKRSCDYIVILSQMGREQDEAFARKWPGIDLIIGGHSQTLLEKPITVSGCRIVQAGKNGGRVGEVVVRFDALKRIRRFSYKLFEITDRYPIPADIKPLLEVLNASRLNTDNHQ